MPSPCTDGDPGAFVATAIVVIVSPSGGPTRMRVVWCRVRASRTFDAFLGVVRRIPQHVARPMLLQL
eukprot:5688007-Prymnesium_polylepis.1